MVELRGGQSPAYVGNAFCRLKLSRRVPAH